MISCDWCGAPMDRILGTEGTVATSFLRGIGSVWLCRHEGCGHEVERFDTDEPLQYWRDELVMRLFERMSDLTAAHRIARLDAILAMFEAARAETERLLAR